MDLPAQAWIGVFAHPDDEWLAGWPVFQSTGVRKGVVFFVGGNHPTAPPTRSVWEPAIRRVLEALDIQLLGCLDCAAGFFCEPRRSRTGWRNRLQNILDLALTGAFQDAALITHNPVGEYGHPDHLAVMQTLLEVSPCQPLYVTDLCYEGQLTTIMRRAFYRGLPVGPYQLDLDTWHRARRLYQAGYHWTAWEEPTVRHANLFQI